jgi:enoyl-CoA hydratase
MGTPVSYHLAGSVAAITMDDGKANVLSPAMLAALNAALDRAEADAAAGGAGPAAGCAVLLAGRPGIFSGGFDLSVIRDGGPAVGQMVTAGFELAARILAFPLPVVIACTGHAVAMGAFLLLAGDYRVGAAGPFRITANEVAIGLQVPPPALELCRQRLTPAAYSRAVILADVFGPADAVSAGFLDELAPAADPVEPARAVAARLSALDRAAHAAAKLSVRGAAVAAIRESLAVR